MTATNHTIAGALVAATWPRPMLAIPLALASHIALDALPHFGNTKISRRSHQYLAILGADSLIALTVLLVVLIVRPSNWQLMLICGVLAASPDLLWLPYWIAELRRQTKSIGPISRFLSWVQWAELPWGWLLELAYFIIGLTLLIPVLSS
ncbi:MAG TPA: hypothetical protein VLF39_01460 [Candidatus Saccharimonadales bacterium]|nr:hypothetical protein [Candidatus Saccharimonadales bacterium]